MGTLIEGQHNHHQIAKMGCVRHLLAATQTILPCYLSLLRLILLFRLQVYPDKPFLTRERYLLSSPVTELVPCRSFRESPTLVKDYLHTLEPTDLFL